MKFFRSMGVACVAGAMLLAVGCKHDETASAGTVPPAWDDPSQTDINATTSSAELPSDWGTGAADDSVDAATGLRRVNVEGFPVTVYFDFDVDTLTPTAASNVARVGAYHKQYAESNDFYLVIEGHCDERGTEEYNRALGERRAIAIENKLKSMGCDLGRIRTVSYGEDKPAVQGNSESALQQNRRGVMWIGRK